MKNPVAVVAFLLGALSIAACGGRHLTAARAAVVEKDVRAFVQVVAHDVTQEGPLAWPKYLDESAAFFLVSNGNLVFRDGASVAGGMQKFASTFPHVELAWGDDLRVDPLAEDLAVVAASYREVLTGVDGSRGEQTGYFTGTAEYRDGRWRFRNQHWSAPVPPPAR